MTDEYQNFSACVDIISLLLSIYIVFGLLLLGLHHQHILHSHVYFGFYQYGSRYPEGNRPRMDQGQANAARQLALSLHAMTAWLVPSDRVRHDQACNILES